MEGVRIPSSSLGVEGRDCRLGVRPGTLSVLRPFVDFFRSSAFAVGRPGIEGGSMLLVPLFAPN